MSEYRYAVRYFSKRHSREIFWCNAEDVNKAHLFRSEKEVFEYFVNPATYRGEWLTDEYLDDFDLETARLIPIIQVEVLRPEKIYIVHLDEDGNVRSSKLPEREP